MLIVLYRIFASQLVDFSLALLFTLIVIIGIIYMISAPFSTSLRKTNSRILNFFKKCVFGFFGFIFKIPKRIYKLIKKVVSKKLTGNKCTAVSLIVTLILILIIL